MVRLKRWESSRYQGRNIKGRGGYAKLRQIRKQQQMLRKKLTDREKGTQGSFFLFIYLVGWQLLNSLQMFSIAISLTLYIRTNSLPCLIS